MIDENEMHGATNSPMGERIGEYVTVLRLPPEPGKKTYVFVVVSGGEKLGMIGYWSPWRQYVFEPQARIIFNHDCLEGIARFLLSIKDLRVPPKGTRAA